MVWDDKLPSIKTATIGMQIATMTAATKIAISIIRYLKSLCACLSRHSLSSFVLASCQSKNIFLSCISLCSFGVDPCRHWINSPHRRSRSRTLSVFYGFRTIFSSTSSISWRKSAARIEHNGRVSYDEATPPLMFPLTLRISSASSISPFLHCRIARNPQSLHLTISHSMRKCENNNRAYPVKATTPNHS